MYSQNPLGLSSKTFPSSSLISCTCFVSPLFPHPVTVFLEWWKGGGCLQELELSSAVPSHFTWVSGSDLIIPQASPTVTSPRWPASPPSFARHRDPKYPCTWNHPGSSPRSFCLHPCLQLLMMMFLLSTPSLPIYHLTHFLTKPAFRSHLSRIKWPEVKQYIKLQLVSVLDTDFLPDKQLHS